MPLAEARPRSAALLALVCAAVALALFWRLPIRGRAYFPADLLAETSPWRDPAVVPRNPASQDPIRQYYPASARLAARGAFRWESALGCGEPVSVQPTCEADSPLARLAYATLPAWAASGLLGALHVFLAGAGMAFWARGRGSSARGALAAGIAYALAPWNLAWLEAGTVGVAWASLPWGLGFLERARRAGDRTLLAGAGLAFGLGALGGHLQVVELGLLAAVAVALVDRGAGDARPLRTRVASLVLALALFAVVGAARLVPAALELGASARGRIPLEDYLATTGSLDLARSLLLLFPDLLGNPVADPVSTSWIERGAREAQANFLEMRPHVGTVVLLLALAGAFARPRRRGLPLLGLAALAFAFALKTPLATVPWALVPGFGATTPLRFLALLPLLVGPLVAEGFDVLAQSRSEARRAALSPVLVVAGLLAVTACYLASEAGPHLVTPGHASKLAGMRAVSGWLSLGGRALGRPVALALATSGLVLVAALAPGLGSRRLARALLVGLLALDLLEGGLRLQTTCEPRDLYPETPAIRAVASRTGENGRVLLAPDVPLDALLPFGVPAVGSYASAHLARTRDLFVALGAADPHARQWLRVSASLAPEWQRFLGVTAILASPNARAPSPDVAVVHSGEATVFAREGAARAWLYPARAVAAVPDQAAALALAASPDFSPLRGAVVESLELAPDDPTHPRAAPAVPAPAPARPVQISEPDPEHVRAVVEAEGPSVLVLADAFAPGWRAEIDGVRAPILPAFVAFRGVLVPPGKHEIAFEFTPPGWPWLSWASAAASLGCALALATRARRAARSSPRSAPS